MKPIYKTLIVVIITTSLILNIIFLSYALNQYSLSTIYLRLSNFLNLPDKILVDKEKNSVEIPSIYTKDKQLVIHSFYNNVKTKEDFETWKKFFNYTTKSIDNYPLMPVSKVQETQKDQYLQKKYTMTSLDGDIIIFYELLPQEPEPPYPAVFILPGSGNQGARDVIGEQTEFSKFYYHNDIGLELVKEGYAVYVMEYRGYGERAIEVGNACDGVNDEAEREIYCPNNILNDYLASLGINLYQLRFNDASQVLKFIHSLDYVDSDRIALSGLSLGGGFALDLSGHNPEIIKATIIASATHAASKGPLTLQTGVTNLLCCDSVDYVAAAIPPRPLYVSFGKNEGGIFAWEAKTNYSGELLKTAYEILEAENNFFYTAHSGKHQYDVDTVIQFLNKWLKPD